MLVLILLVAFAGCARDLVCDGKTYTSYGPFNKDQIYSEDVKYKTSFGNIVWGVLLVETVVAPVYFWGFSSSTPDYCVN